MKHKHTKALSFLLTLALVLGLLPWTVMPARAATAAYDISTGYVTINSGNLASWNGRTVTGSVNADGGTFPKGPSDGATFYRSAICIDGVTVDLTIRDLSIVATFNNHIGAYKVSPILLLNGATLNLTLAGENTLTACVGGAGICVPNGCALTVDGTGSLTVTGGDGGASDNLYGCFGGAAIGTEDLALSREFSKTGGITINGGTIIAQGGSSFSYRGGSAGIGGSGYIDADVTINGGSVTATGGAHAAGIGGGIASGGTITINGGVVTAVTGPYGAAIGSGSGGGKAGESDSTVVINGGNVTAKGNIGSPSKDEQPGDMLTVDFSKASVACVSGLVNCKNAAVQKFNATVCAEAMTPGDHTCTFWINEKNVTSAAVPATLKVSKTGEGKATVTCLVIYGDNAEMQATGHLQTDGATYDTVPVSISVSAKNAELYSGYRWELTGTVYDMDNITAGQTATVSVDGVAADLPAVVSAGKVAVSTLIYLPNEQSTDDKDPVTKQITVTVGDKTYTQDVSFARTGAHQRAGSFLLQENGIEYVDLNGKKQFAANVTLLEANTTSWNVEHGGWYAIAPGTREVTIGAEVQVKGAVNLVLTDGSTLTVTRSITSAQAEGCSLTIWAQDKGTGKLIATDASGGDISFHQPAIGSNYHDFDITINGGTVNATGTTQSAIGSESGDTQINGGTVVATVPAVVSVAAIWSDKGTIRICGGDVTADAADSSYSAIGALHQNAKCSIEISGGTVTAVSGNGAAIGGAIPGGEGSNVTITITGGTVHATSTKAGAGIGSRTNVQAGTASVTTILDYDDPSSGPSVYASSYEGYNSVGVNTVTLKKAFKDATTGEIYQAATYDDLSGIKNKTLVPAASYGIAVDAAVTNGTVTANPSRAVEGARVTLTVEPDAANNYKLKPGSLKVTYAGGEVSLTRDESDPTKYTFTMPGKDVSVTAAFTQHEHSFTYIADGATIKAICGGTGCDLTDNCVVLTITAPESLTCDGYAKAAALAEFDAFNNATGLMVSADDIVYKQGNTVLDAAPVDAGSYTASITLEGETAFVSYNIAQKNATVAAKAQTVTAGGSIETGTAQATLTDALAGHTLTAVTLTASSTAAATTNGTITPSAATIKDANGNDVTGNYNITYKTGILTVKAPATPMLTVAAPTFDAVYAGYAQPAAKALAIKNAGNSDATISGVALSGTNATSFTLNKTSGTIITAGATDSTTYTVQPKAGLAAGTYTATITVTYNNNATATADVSFTVYGAAGDWSGGKLVATVTLPADANALLIAAAYDAAGRQVGVRVIEIKADQTTCETGMAKTTGYTYKLMLVDKTTYAPLCAAWEKKA